MRIATPDQIFQNLIDRLPRSFGDFLWNVSYGLAWVTLPVSFLSAISDLQIVVDWAMRAFAWLRERLPSIDALRDAIVGLVSTWRLITTPLYSWLQDLLPVQLPRIVFDLVVPLVLTLPAFARYTVASTRWRQHQASSPFSQFSSHYLDRLGSSKLLLLASGALATSLLVLVGLDYICR